MELNTVHRPNHGLQLFSLRCLVIVHKEVEPSDTYNEPNKNVNPYPF